MHPILVEVHVQERSVWTCESRLLCRANLKLKSQLQMQFFMKDPNEGL